MKATPYSQHTETNPPRPPASASAVQAATALPPPPKPRISLADWVPTSIAALTGLIVNYGGTFVLIFQAAQAAQLSAAQTASWVWAMSIGIGITGIGLSWHYREPVITAWSTPAAGFLVGVLPHTPYAEAIGAYVLSGAAFLLLGLSGCFEKLVRRIPPGIAAGLLAGILLQFGIGAFTSLKADPLIAGTLIVLYAVLRRFTSRFAIVGILVLGIAMLLSLGRLDLSGVTLSFATPLFVMPEFSSASLLGVAIPLFVITLTGQYMPGMIVMRNDGFKTSANPILSVTGAGAAIMGFFGSHAFNIAAISAAICTGKDAHEDPQKRYLAGIASGIFYILVGIFGVTLASLFMVLPSAFITTLAGLALLGTIGGSLAHALSDPRGRETALITFLATAANVSAFGIGGAFWGLLIGLASHCIMHAGRRPAP